MDNKVLMELAAQFGLSQSAAGAKVKEYVNKSDEEILQELSQLKQTIKKDPRVFEQQMQTIKALAAGMNSQQRERLEKMIQFLES